MHPDPLANVLPQSHWRHFPGISIGRGRVTLTLTPIFETAGNKIPNRPTFTLCHQADGDTVISHDRTQITLQQGGCAFMIAQVSVKMR